MPGVALFWVSLGLDVVEEVVAAGGGGGDCCRPSAVVVCVCCCCWVAGLVAFASSLETFFRSFSILSLYASFNWEIDSKPSSRAFCSSFS